MFERFTDRARGTLLAAQDKARTAQTELTSELLLWGVLDVGGVGAQALSELGVTASALDAVSGLPVEAPLRGVSRSTALGSVGVDYERVREEAERAFGAGALDAPNDVAFTAEARDALELALLHALGWGNNYIGTEHLAAGAAFSAETRAHTALLAIGVAPTDVGVAALRALYRSGHADDFLELPAELRDFATTHPDLGFDEHLERLASDVTSLARSAIDEHLARVHSLAADAAKHLGFGSPPGGTAARHALWFRRELAALPADERSKRRDRFDQYADAAREDRAETTRSIAAARSLLIAGRVRSLQALARQAGWSPSDA